MRSGEVVLKGEAFGSIFRFASLEALDPQTPHPRAGSAAIRAARVLGGPGEGPVVRVTESGVAERSSREGLPASCDSSRF